MTVKPQTNAQISVKGKQWVINEPDAQLIQNLIRAGLSPIEARILAARNISPNQVKDLLEPKLRNQMPDPLVLKNMDLAIEFIIKAIKANKKITIFADYDVDGATSAAILTSWFSKIGKDVNIFIPDRIKDGYGPSPQLMRSIKHDGADLLISVDCGAAAHDALLEAKNIGLDVVVFDHHLMIGNPPPAIAIVNPNQPDDSSGLGILTAAGVCFMAVVALNRLWRENNGETGFSPMNLLDLVALGTICDVAPLTGLNRVFVAQGQLIMGQRKRLGIRILADIAGVKKPDNVYAAAWVLGPRLNAGGRIGDSNLAVTLLNTESPATAKTIALQLEQLNQERRAIEQEMSQDAIKQLEQSNSKHIDPVLIVGKAGWHPGIIGIVAGRIKERYDKPVIILGSASENDTILKGSGRSISGFNLGGAIKNAVDEKILLSGGGHMMAAGLSIENNNIESLRAYFAKNYQEYVDEALIEKFSNIDAIIAVEAINLQLIESLQRLAPFGQGWSEPLFCIANAKITSSQPLNGGHMRVFFTDSSQITQKSVCFNVMGTPLGEMILNKATCNLIVKVKKDDWRGANAVDTEIIDAFTGFVTH